MKGTLTINFGLGGAVEENILADQELRQSSQAGGMDLRMARLAAGPHLVHLRAEGT